MTGSSTGTNSKEVTHSGTGRFSWLRLRPMPLYESEDSTGEVSLMSLFSQSDSIFGQNRLSFDDWAYLVCRGGWPHSVSMKKDIALLQPYDYVDGLLKRDINKVDGANKNEEVARWLLRSYARNSVSAASYENIRTDVSSSNGNEISGNIFSSYVMAMKNAYVIEDIPSWNPTLRSKTAIRAKDTRYLVDPSIAVASLGLGPADLSMDLNTFGFLFECLCVRDLRVNAESIGGSVFRYRDKNDLECDAVIHLRNGKYGLAEIKLGWDVSIAEAKSSLNKLHGILDVEKMNEPSFKMVLIGVGDYAYRDNDGVYIIPLGCLKN